METVTRDLVSTEHPPCPPWCKSDYDYTDAFAADSHRIHHCDLTTLTLSDPDGEYTHKITLSLERYDYGGVLGEPVVHTAELTPDCYGNVRPVGLIPIPLSVASVRELGNALLALAAQGSTARPEFDVERLTDPRWWECAACSHWFELDSSPDLELCCGCAEVRDAEAGR